MSSWWTGQQASFMKDNRANAISMPLKELLLAGLATVALSAQEMRLRGTNGMGGV